jgi:hypothetical protein
MTNKELNKAVKVLKEEIYRISFDDLTEYLAYLDGDAKKEFKRIIGADNSFKAFTAESLRILIMLNLRHRFVSLHTFGLHIEENQ